MLKRPLLILIKYEQLAKLPQLIGNEYIFKAKADWADRQLRCEISIIDIPPSI